MSNAPITDPRVLAGMKAQLGTRATQIAAGGKRLGWKAGFGAPAALKNFNLPGPLVGYMLAAARVPSGESVSLKGWTKPVAEPEIAVWLGADLVDGRDPAAVKGAIEGLSPAIELADLNPPPEDVTKILAGNIFHRHVVLGRCDTSRAGARLDDITCSVTRKGAQSPPASELEGNTGRILDVVAQIAETLAATGEKLQRGDVIICGSIVPPIFLDADDGEITHRLAGLGEVSVRLTWS